MASSTDRPVFLHAVNADSETRVCDLDMAALRAAFFPPRGAEAPPLTLNLSAELALTLRTVSVKPVGAGGAVWRGGLPGMPDVRAYLAAMGLDGSGDAPPVVSGCVMLNGRDYAIRPETGGRVRIARVRRAPGFCGGALVPDTAPADAGDIDIEQADEEAGTAVIHVLALYPPDIRIGGVGGEAAVAAAMAVARTQTNEAFLHSGIDARVEITVRALPSLPHVDVVALLAAVTGKPGGPLWNEVSAARDQARAAVVALLTDQARPNDFGLVMGKAASIPEPPRRDASDLLRATFAIVVDGDSRYTFSHELGHLLGGKHDRLTQPGRGPFSPQYDYVRGHVPADKSFVTVMGYEDEGLSRVPAYSAADRSWNGKALGIPLGQPDAADAARFFRLSTQVVARYRGASAPLRDVVALELSVDPALGGTATPGMLGPYARGSLVSVTATPRVGYRFARWMLDGRDAGSDPHITVSMEQAHALAAVFVDGDQWCRLEVAPLPADAGGRIVLTPPGPAYLPGSMVNVELTALAPGHALEQWRLDGQPVGGEASLALRMERAHHLEAKLRDNRTLSRLREDQILEADGERRLTVRVLDKTNGAPLPEQWIAFSLPRAPKGTRLKGEPRVRTDAEGYAHATLQTGSELGAVQVDARLSTGAAVRFDFEIAGRVLVITGGNKQSLFSGDTPAPLRVQVREMGRPVGAGTQVTFVLAAAGPGLLLPDTHATTNSQGEASIQLSGRIRPPGHAIIGAAAEGAHEPVLFDVWAVENRSLEIAPKLLRLKVGDSARLTAMVQDDGHLGRHVPVRFSLDAGTTGLTLPTGSVPTDDDGKAVIHTTAATAGGTARITVVAAHADGGSPAQTCELHVRG
ncbi:InlB B-repeat-containing protein [Chromobacterium sp. CV08]|uniref:InlB B-repeat-containing protein n=1 Tax=Chromobacterium sp. CV08 TaxID=3133274 RepID=UPI003DA82956